MKKFVILFLLTVGLLHADTLEQTLGYVAAGDLNRALSQVEDLYGNQRTELLQAVVEAWSPITAPHLAADIRKAAKLALPSEEAEKIYDAVKQQLKAAARGRRVPPILPPTPPPPVALPAPTVPPVPMGLQFPALEPPRGVQASE